MAVLSSSLAGSADPRSRRGPAAGPQGRGQAAQCGPRAAPSLRPADLLTTFLPPFSNSPNRTCCKREKRKKKVKTQKSQTKTNLECVAKCCFLLVASVYPCGPQPARLPLPVCCVSCPPAHPTLLLMTRSSVPGCSVMVIDDNV